MRSPVDAVLQWLISSFVAAGLEMPISSHVLFSPSAVPGLLLLSAECKAVLQDVSSQPTVYADAVLAMHSH